MEVQNFSLHYYLENGSHSLDAFTRNKCEAELLAIVQEISQLLKIEIHLETIPPHEGGYIELWKALGDNSGQIGVLIALVSMVLTAAIPLYLHDPELVELEKEEKRLSIQEKHLNIQKLIKESAADNLSDEAIKEIASNLNEIPKIAKKKSNFYKYLLPTKKITSIGFASLDEKLNPTDDELIVHRHDFPKFVLHTDDLPSEKDNEAVIEIISPVLKSGKHKWKGVYKETEIHFSMKDKTFKKDVLNRIISFQHGSKILCILEIHRKLDEIGNTIISGYSVITVLDNIIGETIKETTQGKKYRNEKKYLGMQANLFGDDTNF
jgi:hypothetical protein